MNVGISRAQATDLISSTQIGAPAYIAKIKPGRFPRVLRNLHLPAIVLNSAMMLLILALLPLQSILQGANVLSLLAQVVSSPGLPNPRSRNFIFAGCRTLAPHLGGRGCNHRTLWWCPHWFVKLDPRVQSLTSAVGILSACELLEQLARDRVIPLAFLNVLPKTGAPHVAILSFVAFSGVLYASAGASLSIVSKMYAAHPMDFSL